MSWTQGGVKFRMVIRRDGRHARPHDRVERQRRPYLHSRQEVHRNNRGTQWFSSVSSGRRDVKRSSTYCAPCLRFGVQSTNRSPFMPAACRHPSPLIANTSEIHCGVRKKRAVSMAASSNASARAFRAPESGFGSCSAPVASVRRRLRSHRTTSHSQCLGPGAPSRSVTWQAWNAKACGSRE